VFGIDGLGPSLLEVSLGAVANDDLLRALGNQCHGLTLIELHSKHISDLGLQEAIMPQTNLKTLDVRSCFGIQGMAIVNYVFEGVAPDKLEVLRVSLEETEAQRLHVALLKSPMFKGCRMENFKVSVPK